MNDEIPIERTLNERVIELESQLAMVESIIDLNTRIAALEAHDLPNRVNALEHYVAGGGY